MVSLRGGEGHVMSRVKKGKGKGGILSDVLMCVCTIAIHQIVPSV